METKLSLLTRLLEELERGVPEEQIRSEYDAAFGKGSLDRLLNPRKEGTKRFDDNPLVLRAEENGAIRALRENRQKDRKSPKDDFRIQILDEERKRLSGITLHYNKIKELLLPLIQDLPKESKEEIVSDRDIALSDRKNFQTRLKAKDQGHALDESFQKRISSLTICIHTENEYLLPLLDERLNEFSLFLLKQNRDAKGYFLIRYSTEKGMNYERNH